MVGLGDLPGGSFFSGARAISADGSTVVGGGRSDAGAEAFVWTAVGGMVGLGDLPGGAFDSTAYGVSADGSTVVGRSSSAGFKPNEAFRWTRSDGMVGLGDLPGGLFSSWARGVSADGSTVVGQGSSEWGDAAFIWDVVNGMRALQDVLLDDFGLDLGGASVRLVEATAISPDGTVIVGTGLNAVGQTEAWLVSLRTAQVPVPGGLGLLGVGALVMGLMPRRRPR